MDSVTNIAYSVTGPNAVLVTWDTVIGATSYLIEVRSNNVTLETMSVTVPEVPLTVLTIGKLYEVLVVPTDGTVEGPMKRHVVYLSVKDWLPRVPNLAYTELATRDGFNVTWDPSTSATSYRLIAETYDDNTVVYDGPASSPYTLTGLVPETLYRVTLIPVNGTEEGIAAVIVGWVQPVIDQTRNTQTSHLLFPASTQGSYHLIYQPYMKNMRQLREDERYWRYVDYLSFANVAVEGSTVDNRATELFSARIVGAANNQISIRNEATQIDRTDHSITHDKALLSVSLEFDQVGRPLLVYEDIDHDIFFYWYDPQISQQVSVKFGNGYTPHICTTSYFRFDTESASERLLFFIRSIDNRVVFLRQAERYETVHELPVVPGTVLELLEVSKDLYSGLTVNGCVLNNGDVDLVTWTAPPLGGDVGLGTDEMLREMVRSSFHSKVDVILSYHALVSIPGTETPIAASSTGSVSAIEIVNKVINTSLIEESITTSASGQVTTITIENKVIRTGDGTNGESTDGSTNAVIKPESTTANLFSGAVNAITVEDVVINLAVPVDKASEYIVVNTTSTVNSITISPA